MIKALGLSNENQGGKSRRGPSCIFTRLVAWLSNLQHVCVNNCMCVWELVLFVQQRERNRYLYSKIININYDYLGKRRAAVKWGWWVATCFNPMPSCRSAAVAGEGFRSMAAPWIKLQIEFSGAALPLFISAVSPSEAPQQAIYGALFLGKLITWVQPGRSLTHTPALSHLGLELLRHTQSIMKWERGHPQSSPTLAPHGLSHRSIPGIILIIIALDFSQRTAKLNPLGPTYWQEL